MSTCAFKGQERDPLELDFQVVVSYIMWGCWELNTGLQEQHTQLPSHWLSCSLIIEYFL